MSADMKVILVDFRAYHILKLVAEVLHPTPGKGLPWPCFHLLEKVLSMYQRHRSLQSHGTVIVM